MNEEHAHHHHHHGAHEPDAHWREAYDEAYRAAQPDPGRQVIPVSLEAGEFDWEFRPGIQTRAWGFGRQVPGPVIEARVGDVLEVRLENRLPEPTAIHWHGLRLPAVMDGTESVQRPVGPGESFTYRFRARDAGTFWYHPHVNETVQLERGLYGPLIVRAEDEPVLDRERIVMFDDIELDRSGQVKPPGWWLEKHDGREGGVRLINGRSGSELEMAAGQVERWRVLNAASARTVRLSIGNRPFQVLGTTGGLIERPVTATEWLLPAATRVDLAVGPFAEGEIVPIDSLPYKRGKIRTRKETESFGTVRVGPPAASRARIPETLRRIEPLVAGTAAPTREVHLGFTLHPQHGVRFVINKEPHHRDQPVRLGELQVWDVVNDSPVDHPFHLHGFFFQVLEVGGKPPAFRSWEDTVNVPAGSRVRIAWMPDERPGEWMYHCHILEHHAAGMMAHFEIVP